MAQIAGTDLTAAGLADGGIPILTVNGGQSSVPFELKNGNSGVSTFPVPSVQPSAAGAQTIAFDIIPKGNPSDFAGNGIAWMDFCNRDIVNNAGQQFGCAHLGVFANGDMALGPTAYNGASVGNLKFQIGGVDKLTVTSAGFVQFAGTSFSANGAVATSLGSVGPTGANTAVQEWLTIKNASGVTRYVPCF